jgi:hypothetical protein
VREVGDDLRSIGDRLVWGAVGTLMEAPINAVMLTLQARLTGDNENS